MMSFNIIFERKVQKLTRLLLEILYLIYLVQRCFIFMPLDGMIGDILFLFFLSVYLSTYVSVVNFNLPYNFLIVIGRDFIYSKLTAMITFNHKR